MSPLYLDEISQMSLIIVSTRYVKNMLYVYHITTKRPAVQQISTKSHYLTLFVYEQHKRWLPYWFYHSFPGAKMVSTYDP